MNWKTITKTIDRNGVKKVEVIEHHVDVVNNNHINQSYTFFIEHIGHVTRLTALGTYKKACCSLVDEYGNVKKKVSCKSIVL